MSYKDVSLVIDPSIISGKDTSNGVYHREVSHDECRSSIDQEPWPQEHEQRAVPRQASVILKDGRRVRRSVTMTSLNDFRDIDADAEERGAQHAQAANQGSRVGSAFTTVAAPLVFLLRPLLAPANHGLVKCVIAYFIASLAVFVPHISELIGHGDGKHFVATCTVYFHPSRSIGSMLQATTYALIALLWAVFLSTSSMATAIGFNSIGQRALGHVVVLIVYVCGGIGLIGYWKQIMADPTVGVAASMASMVVFFNVTREGSLQLGQFNLRKILQYFFIVLLGLLISGFVNTLLWPVSARKTLKRDVTQTTSQYSHLLSLVTRRFLRQAESGTLQHEYRQAVEANLTMLESLQKGLTEAKFEYYILGEESEYHILVRVVKSLKNLAQHLNGLRSSCEAQVTLMSIDSTHLTHNLEQRNSVASSERVEDIESVAEEIVNTFAYHLGPPMKSLAYTTKQALQAINFDKEYTVTLSSQLFSNLDRALSLYDEAREDALAEMYRHPIFESASGLVQLADREEIAASMDYFSYSLQEFVVETRQLMAHLKELEKHHVARPSRSWSFLKLRRLGRRSHQSLGTGVSASVLHDKSSLNETPNDSIQEKIAYRIWLFLRKLKSTEIRFAIKVGVGAALFAMPAMIDSSRPLYVEWRMEWGLLSFFIILSASLGGTYSAAFWRVMGSALGTGLAMITWTLFPGNAYALAPCGILIATPCMWMIINPKKANAQFGRFILLSYNLTALYAFSLSKGVLDDDDDEGGLRPIITLIALHRIVSVTAGCLWGALINTYVWPIKARVELREGLSRLWLRLGWSWRKDPFLVFTDSAFTKQGLKAQGASLETSLALQTSLATLSTLLSQTPNEPRLRGKFPVAKYGGLIRHTQDIQDSMYALSSALSKTRSLDKTEVNLLKKTQRQRNELGDLLFLYFYLLAGAMRLCLPLPSRFPSVSNARERLLARISELRAASQLSQSTMTDTALQTSSSCNSTATDDLHTASRPISGGDYSESIVRGSHDIVGSTATGREEENYSASFIYTLMTLQVTQSLDAMAVIVQDLFGRVDELPDTSHSDYDL